MQSKSVANRIAANLLPVWAVFTLLALALVLSSCSSSGGADKKASYATITAGQLRQLLDSGQPPLVVDLREPSLFKAGHVPGARNIPFEQFADRAGEIPSGPPIVLVCHSGPMGDISATLLSERGYAGVSNLQGGMTAWDGKLER